MKKVGAGIFLVLFPVVVVSFFALSNRMPQKQVPFEGGTPETDGERIDTKNPTRRYNLQEDAGGNEFALEFFIPEGWEVEYDDSARILNLFTLSGKGSARERSQILFTYFDASQFLTLSTVTIHKVSDLVVGRESYTAKRYDIEKRSGAVALQGQPSWRGERHIAIDFRNQEGRTRYYSIAKNPELDEEIFQRVLDSIKIVK